MVRVQMVLFGNRVEVDADQVKLHEQKMASVNAARYLINQSKNRTLNLAEKDLLDKHMGKIQRLNKKIRQNVTFLA